ncbi:MAG TPA: gluconeogenesis factor YvcK family protein [Candidatus Saccharimonadia bacterium]|jgi:uncharacterized cofD-like protein
MASGRGPKVVVIGGGTGTFTVLSGLKHYVGDITAIVNMVDDGGSTGVLRDELGALPPGDVRQSLVALSDVSKNLRELFNYRFPKGSFASGHSFGNLFISALEQVTGSMPEAVKVAGEVLSIQGQVIPATTDNVHLILETADGRIIRGEDKIGEGPAHERLFVKGAPHKLWLEPAATLNPKAKQAIAEADLIVIAPGKLYSSILPSLLIEGMPDALCRAKGRKIYVCNLMTRPNQTAGFSVQDFADEVERYAGAPMLDCVIYNTERPSKYLLDKYALEGEREPVEFNTNALASEHYQAIGEPLISKTQPKQPGSDLLKRTLIRHDSDKVARLIMRIYFS